MNGMHTESLPWLRPFASGEYDEFKQFGQFFWSVPFRDYLPLVGAHQPVELGVGEALFHRFDGPPGIRWRWGDDVMVVDLCPVELGCGKLAHGESVRAARMIHSRFMRRLLTGEKKNPIEMQLIHCGRGNVCVAEVDGVKGATKKTNLFR